MTERIRTLWSQVQERSSCLLEHYACFSRRQWLSGDDGSVFGCLCFSGAAFVMRGVLIALGSAALVVVITALGVLLLPACGIHSSVASTWLAWCPAEARQLTEERLATIWNSNHDLRRRILERERELASMQCEPQTASVAQLPLPAAISHDDWNARDVGLLEGCWSLDTRFSTEDQETGVVSIYDIWNMCFDSQGLGTEEMRSSSGSTCAGEISAHFDADGSLMIEEPGDLQCSDGAYIFQLLSRCSLYDDGTAGCVVNQPETGISTTVRFRRAVRGD